jgi:hypothetical protein
MKSLFFAMVFLGSLPIVTGQNLPSGLSMSDPDKKPSHEPKAIDYPMSKIPKDSTKFAEILAAINDATRRELSHSGIQLSPEAQRAIAMAPRQIVKIDVGDIPPFIEILQKLNDSQYLAISQNVTIAIKVIGDNDYVDHQKVCGTLVQVGENFQYTDTLGAKRTVKSYEFKPYTDHQMTADRLIERLQAGEVITITKGKVEAKCQTCDGWGRISGKRAGDPKKECNYCKGAGKRMEDLFLRIKWD